MQDLFNYVITYIFIFEQQQKTDFCTWCQLWFDEKESNLTFLHVTIFLIKSQHSRCLEWQQYLHLPSIFLVKLASLWKSIQNWLNYILYLYLGIYPNDLILWFFCPFSSRSGRNNLVPIGLLGRMQPRWSPVSRLCFNHWGFLCTAKGRCWPLFGLTLQTEQKAVRINGKNEGKNRTRFV